MQSAWCLGQLLSSSEGGDVLQTRRRVGANGEGVVDKQQKIAERVEAFGCDVFRAALAVRSYAAEQLHKYHSASWIASSSLIYRHVGEVAAGSHRDSRFWAPWDGITPDPQRAT
jgi:hypothetical protein